MTKRKLTRSEVARLGGLAVREKRVPHRCPRCGKMMPLVCEWHAYLGHLGLHGIADKYFDGDFEAAHRHLQRNGLAKSDPIGTNSGVYPKYVPLEELEQ